MKNVVWAVLPLLAACDTPADDSKEAFDDAIVLECAGDDIDLVSSKREPSSHLIRILPNNSLVDSLHYYNWAEKQFVERCLDKGFDCRMSIGPDLISEFGSLRGSDEQVKVQMITEINRRTGAMRVTTKMPWDEGLTFEGKCSKGELPVEEEQKF